MGEAADDRGAFRRGVGQVTHRVKPPFRADHVGSLLRSAALKDARGRRERGEITPEQLRAVEDREIETLIKKQEAVGLKSITDGENRRKSWQTDFIAALALGAGLFQRRGAQETADMIGTEGRLGALHCSFTFNFGLDVSTCSERHPRA